MMIILRREILQKALAVLPLLLVTFLCLAQQCGGAPMPRDAIQDDELRRKVDDFVNALMVEESMIGLTLAVTKDGQPFMTRGYGTTKLGGNVSVTPDTLFYLASCTKAFTATLLTMLVDGDERYTLETRVQDIYSDFHVQEGYRSKQASLRDILSHRIGYHDTIFSWFLGAVTERLDLISRARFLDASAPFRGSYTYSNTMLTIAGYVAGLLDSQVSWEESLSKNLLQPLGMTGTTFMYEANNEQLSNTATPYEPDRLAGGQRQVSMDVFGENQRAAGPSGALLTNSNDMQKWLAVLSNKGLKQDGSRLISQDVLEETMMGTSYAFALPPPQGNGSLTQQYLETGAALGWYSGLYRGYRMATHGGYMFGFQSLVTVLPDVGAGIYIGINGQNGDLQGGVMRRVANFVFDLFLGFKNATNAASQGATVQEVSINSAKMDQLPIGGAASFKLKSEKTKRAVSSQDECASLSNYEGTYGHFFLGNATVSCNATDGLLHAIYGSLGKVTMYGIDNVSFAGIVQEPVWFAPPLAMFFAQGLGDSSDGPFETVTIPFLYPQSPPTFIRGLKMDDAPSPEDDVITSHARWFKMETGTIFTCLATTSILLLMTTDT